MLRKTTPLLFLGLPAALLAASAEPTPPVSSPINEPIQPIPFQIPVDRARARLGAKLFFDPQLSQDRSVSCASCHFFDHGGADFTAKSVGTDGKIGGINSPSIFNLEFNFRYNWTGIAESLLQHLELPMRNPTVMGIEFTEIVSRLENSGDYPEQFKKAFADGLNVENFKLALVEYERSLITPNARFDRWLRGEKSALNEQETAGYRLFKNLGCTSCHQGVNVGGNLFQKFGVMGDYFTDRGNVTTSDYGRFNVTKDERDRFVFRVPSLRNVAMTAPYFHDGTAANLPAAVRIMARYQLGRLVSEDEVAKITAFLSTLTGELAPP